MQLRTWLLLALATSSAALVHGESGKGKPGYCLDSKACADTYTCVSVQTTRSGVTDVKQCLPTASGNPVCTGTAPGLCPSFSTTWGTTFRQIASVCAYISPEANGVKCVTGASTNSSKGVNCLSIQDPTDPKNSSATIGVIYGCVDFDGSRLLFDKNSKSDKLSSQFNYSAIIASNCVNPKNPSGSTFVCSSQGTCAPTSANSMDYKCSCNVGFSGTYCEKIVDNKCYNDGVCGGGSCDLAKNECTDCKAGTLGNKCSQCDPTYDPTKVCSGHGKCVATTSTSTLGADGSSAGSSSSTSSSTSTSTTTSSNSTSTTTTKPSTKSKTKAGSSSGGGEVVATVKPARMLFGERELAGTVYQCQCDTGYSDVHCAVKVKVASNSSTTPAPSTGSPATTVTTSLFSVALAAVVAVAVQW